MRSKSSAQWLLRQQNDPYTIRSKIDGYRSRAAYKLIEINDKDQLLKQGMCVIDLGAAPGSWSQIAINRVGHKGRVIGLDLLPIKSLPGLTAIQADFRDLTEYDHLKEALGGKLADLVISDMAPNLSGIGAVDQAKMMHLVETVLDLLALYLKPQGNLLIKLFQGPGYNEFIKILRSKFKQIKYRKPKSSRPESKEIYVVAKNFTE